MTHTEHAELRRLIRSDFDYDTMMQCAWLLSAEYPFLGFGYLGESAAGRGIPRFSLGEGKKEIYYIGVHHGAERITGAVLVHFLLELCALAASDANFLSSSASPVTNVTFIIERHSFLTGAM